MRQSSRFLKSLGLVALVACTGAASTGCVLTDGNGGGDPGSSDNNNPPPPVVQGPTQQMQIDADATLQAKGGDGVGVFVEYKTGGHWHVFTACDFNQPTNPNGMACTFEVSASVITQGKSGAGITNAKGESLANKDTVALQGDGTAHLFTETTTGLNGMTFDAPVGAVVELDVLLDSVEDPHYFYWIGKKVLHQGGPSDPLDLAPSEPSPTSKGPGAPAH